MGKLSIITVVMAGFVACASELNVLFDDENVLQGIRVDDVLFATGGGDLWTAEFSSGTNREKRFTVRAGDATEKSARENTDGWVLRWRDLPIGAERGVLDAQVYIRRRSDGSTAWELKFENCSREWALLTTDFPRLNSVVREGASDVMLPWKDHGARLFKKWKGVSREQRYDYLGYYPQVSAFLGDGKGLYVAAEDPDARQKSFVVKGTDVRFFTPVEWGGAHGKAAEGPRYPVVIAALRGDWWCAARRYREFALRQKWCAKGQIKNIPTYPRRLAEIPLWINVHCSPQQVSNLLFRAKSLFPDFSTGIHWHLWQHSGHDVNYPEYFPEQPGAKECIASCGSISQEPMPYTNGRLWTATTAGFIMAEQYAVMKATGKRAIEKYAPWTPELAVMCPSCPMWHRVMQFFSERVLDELGAKSIFMDQIGAAPGCACYDPLHSHPSGGGGWWYDGYEAALKPIRAAYNAKGAFLTTEGAGEAYVGMVDGFLQVVARTPEDVPFLNAVYSGYTTYFCSPENTDDDAASFRALQTRELLWGNSLGWFLQDILDKPDKCGILRQLCGFRQKNLDALAYGTLLDELRFAEPVGAHRYEWLGRRPHFRLFDKTYKLPPSSFATMPDVIGNWWRAEDGETVLLAANLTDVRQSIRYIDYKSKKVVTIKLAPYELVRKADENDIRE